MPNDNGLHTDVLWGEGMPPKNHEGRYAVLLLEKEHAVWQLPVRNMEVREVSARMLGPRGWKVRGYFILPASKGFWDLFNRSQSTLKKPIDECEFSIRAHVRLQQFGVSTLGELAACDAPGLRSNTRLRKEVQEVLGEHGLELVHA
jgi:hypothetical protein